MLRNSMKQAISVTTNDATTGPSCLVPGSSSASIAGCETPTRPRKKLSFKEPEILDYLRLRKPFGKPKPAPLVRSKAVQPSSSPPKSPTITTTPATTTIEEAVDLNENPFEEENGDLDELESQAMRVVRTVGQAFEVCHKLSLSQAPGEDRDRGDSKESRDQDENLRDTYEDQVEISNDLQSQPSPSSVHKDLSLLGDIDDSVPEQTSVSCLLRSHDIPATTASTSPIRQSPSGTVTSDCGGMLVGGELTALKHEIQLLRERLDQQSQQTRAAVAHARLLQDQLAAETAARVEAQTRTHQLLVQNKELLEHIGALVGHLREQERIANSSGHVSAPSQIPGQTSNLQQTTTTVPDLSNLGQCSRPGGGQSSPWELEPPTFTCYSYPSDSLYPGNFNTIGIQGHDNSTDQLHFQSQLLERLHNISPYQPQRSPYATPSPYAMGTGLLLPPNSRPPNSAQLSPNMSLRVSQPNSFSSSPVMSHKLEKYGVISSQENSDTTFIKPLPCSSGSCGIIGERNSFPPSHSEVKGKQAQERISTTEESMPPIILNPPPAGKRLESKADNKRTNKEDKNSKEQSEKNGKSDESQNKNLATILRSPGPPPSRTTSARLPARNDLMNQVQRTTWARHTTK